MGGGGGVFGGGGGGEGFGGPRGVGVGELGGGAGGVSNTKKQQPPHKTTKPKTKPKKPQTKTTKTNNQNTTPTTKAWLWGVFGGGGGGFKWMEEEKAERKTVWLGEVFCWVFWGVLCIYGGVGGGGFGGCLCLIWFLGGYFYGFWGGVRCEGGF